MPRSHAMLTVVAEGRTWLADVGFGGEGLVEPMPFEQGAGLRPPAVTVHPPRARPADHRGRSGAAGGLSFATAGELAGWLRAELGIELTEPDARALLPMLPA
ncbi:arylamine N-acetyltransferase [Nonomuraea thailandensis]|uniref:Arylamine N-acetyltransferase n=1 Tax=Nonomuraea thailandensis TaxID=1188745 RepID=A0A9X2GQJ6_9ACTN|nr:arylamine N-acetyltransferase [Nonomuraea thailandensis]MCP2358678.1 arylamine N-acetyltransferase [Nonomuraea thailandensis]